MGYFLRLSDRTIGPIQTNEAGHFVLSLMVLLALIVSLPMNLRLNRFLCDVDEVASRGVCSEFEAYVVLHSAGILFGLLLLLILRLSNLRVVFVYIVSVCCSVSVFLLLTLWVFVLISGNTMHPRELTGVNERSAIAANMIVAVGMLALCGLTAFRNRR